MLVKVQYTNGDMCAKIVGGGGGHPEEYFVS